MRETLWRQLFREVRRYRPPAVDGWQWVPAGRWEGEPAVYVPRFDLVPAPGPASCTDFQEPDPATIAHRPPHWARALPTELRAVERVSKCGRVVLKDSAGLAVGPAGARWRGVSTCGNVWACPVCSARIMAGRVEELRTLLTRHLQLDTGAAMPDGKSWRRPDRSVAMLTLTVPHCRLDGLEELRRMVRDAWRAVQQGRAWRELRERFAVAGTVAALEVTHGKHGWHPHLHILVLFDRQMAPRDLTALRRLCFVRWSRAVGRAGHPLPSYAHGVDLRAGDAGAAAYIAKLELALELTSATSKRARHGGRTPFRILQDYTEHGRPADWRLFREWIDGMRGARQLTWSRGLKARYAIADPSDEELAAADPAPEDPVVLVFDKPEYEALAAIAGALATVQRTAEELGAIAARQLAYDLLNEADRRERLRRRPYFLDLAPVDDLPADARWWMNN